MKVRDISNLLLTLIGLGVIIRAIFVSATISAFFLTMFSDQMAIDGAGSPLMEKSYYIVLFITQVIIPVVFGLVLIFCSKRITNWILRWVSNDDRTIGNINPYQISHLAFVLLGVFLLATTLPDAAGYIGRFFSETMRTYAFAPPDIKRGLYYQALGQGVSHLLAVGFSLGIIWKAKALAGFVAGRHRHT